MPNWKTYESSVRLLSAIIAAHPDLKLNYDGKQTNFLVSVFVLLKHQSCVMPDALAEVGKKYGGGTTYKAVWGRMTQIKDYAKLINGAIESGVDPITIELSDAPTRALKQGQGSYFVVLSVLPYPAQYSEIAFRLHLLQ
jgi:hypothetical protein